MRPRFASYLPLLCILAPTLVQASPNGVRPEDWAPGSSIKRIAAGVEHSCAIAGDETVHCWGFNGRGQLGTDNVIPSDTPVRITGSLRATMMSVNRDFSCALSRNGRVACWGQNETGQLGTGDLGDRDVPTFVNDLGQVRAVSAGNDAACAVLTDGSVRCWGSNASGQLGSERVVPATAKPLPVASLTDAIDVEMSTGLVSASVCALSANGRVRCWGRNGSGQLGDGTQIDRSTPVAVKGLVDAIGIAVGSDFACALRRTGAVVCWGANANGQLGNGTQVQSSGLVAVSSLSGATSITAGNRHACARLVDGTVRCWGDNSDGQLGDGTRTARPTRVTVPGLANVLSIDAGLRHTCALLANDTLRCWGEGSADQLGNGQSIDQLLPAAVSTLAGSITARAVAAGDAFNCAIRSNGTVACWGANGNGQLGDRTRNTRSLPTAVPDPANVVALSAGAFHACALQANGRVSCWGRNSNGQIGNGLFGADVLAPFATSITDAVAIVAGTTFTCALRVGGTVRCWGAGALGQLGDGQLLSNGTPVTPSGLGSNIVALGAGEAHACALRFDGELRCWGDNFFGQVGDGTVIIRATQRTVVGPANFVAIELGGEHSCAIRVDGTLACWGKNHRGQIGNGTTDISLVPTLVPDVPGFSTVSAGGDTTCTSGGGGFVCWGRNDSGQALDGTADRLGPFGTITIFPLPRQLAVGFQHGCGVANDGVPHCWGRNSSGQIGVGTLTNLELMRPVPSFALNLSPTGALAAAGQGARVAVLAICADGAQARLRVVVRQGKVEAAGKGVGQCTGALERFEVEVRTRRGAVLAAAPVSATAVAQIVAHGEVIDSVEWSRQVALTE